MSYQAFQADAFQNNAFQMDALGGAEHGAAQSLIGEVGFLEHIEHHIVGGVVGLIDFLHDHAAFAFQFFGVQRCILHQVCHHVDG